MYTHNKAVITGTTVYRIPGDTERKKNRDRDRRSHVCDCLLDPGRFKLLLYTIQITHTQLETNSLDTDRVYPPDARLWAHVCVSVKLEKTKNRQSSQRENTHTHTHTHAHARTHRTHTHRTHARTPRTHTHATHARSHACTQDAPTTNAHTHTHTHTHTPPHTTQTQTHTHTHTHTHTQRTTHQCWKKL